MNTHRRLAAAAVLGGLLIPPLGAETFFYKQNPGDKYRILSTVHETVYVNQRLSHESEILNRIAVSVGEERNGMSRHEAAYQSAERSQGPGEGFQWAREYRAAFDRDRRGYMRVGDEYYMPMVRDVPVFPDRDLRAGETWTAPGHEMHDFRDSFGISGPYRIPFTANYTYLGQREWKGRSYPAIGVQYRIAAEPPAASEGVWPVKIEGSTDQVIFWDLALGQPAAYQETFQMAFTLSDGVTVEYRGSAEAEIVESAVMNKDALAREIAGAIEQLGITDAEVRTEEGGVVISLENIQFEGDSAALLPPERAKLDKIGAILRRYADRDILVGGHTALAGTEQGRMRLSQDRAAAVADYFIARDIRKPDRVVVQGYGAERPLGSNNTEAGRRRNRRVEITVLEN